MTGMTAYNPVREEGMKSLVKDAFQNESAELFFWQFMDAMIFFDDIADGDYKYTLDDVCNMFMTVIFSLPFNTFASNHAVLIYPVLRKSILDWENATRIERRMIGRNELDESERELLKISYERRNSPVDVAIEVVDMLHGPKKRREFADKWIPISRNYEQFDEYVAKVTALTRPEKPAYVEA